MTELPGDSHLTLAEPSTSALAAEIVSVCVTWAVTVIADARVIPGDEGVLALVALCNDPGAWTVSARLEHDTATVHLIANASATVCVTSLERATQIDLRLEASADAPLLTLVVRDDEVMYVRSDLPGLAGLKGGTYDVPVARIVAAGGPRRGGTGERSRS